MRVKNRVGYFDKSINRLNWGANTSAGLVCLVINIYTENPRAFPM